MSVIFLVTAGLYFAAFVLLLIYCFNNEKDILWLIAIAIFVFGTVIGDDMTAASFAAVLTASVLLVFFCVRGNIVQGLSMIFVILGGILSNILDNILILVILVIPVFMLIGKYSAVSEKSKTERPEKKDAENSAEAQ